MGISNEQKYGKMLGGSKAKSRKNNNNNVYRQPTFADIMGIQEGTGGVHSPIAPDPYTGFGSTTQYEEPVHSDFGMTPQAPRSEYFGPSWGPGAGNASESEYFKKVQAVADSGPILNSKKLSRQQKSIPDQEQNGHRELVTITIALPTLFRPFVVTTDILQLALHILSQ